MKRSASSFHQFKARIPRDVLPKARGITLALPVGDRTVTKTVPERAEVVTVSLATRDPAEAKARQADLLSYLEGVWRSLREGPRRLSHREVVALSGNLYRAFAETLEADPGHPEIWDRVEAANLAAQAGVGGLASLMALPENRMAHALEARFGPFVDAVLARERLTVDADSRRRLLSEAERAMTQAAAKLRANAEGDYRPDPEAARFPDPAVVRTSNPAKPKDRSDFDAILADWWREQDAAGRSPKTRNAYRTAFKHLREFLGHSDAARLTKADVIAFKDARVAAGVSPTTIKGADLAGLKSVLAWAVANDRLASNPAEGVTVSAARKVRTRSKAFTDDEATAILRASLSYAAPKREGAKQAAAKRWVPWLMAFTGARVGEIVQLRREDVREVAGRWTIRLTPEAGTVKTGVARTVPVHPQIVALAFPEFAQGSTPGHLFVTPSDPNDPSGVVRGVVNRLQGFVREVVPDPAVAPNHGWRHRFHSKAREVGIEDGVARAIVGHAKKDVHDAYGDVTVAAMARAIDLLPPIDVNAS